MCNMQTPVYEYLVVDSLPPSYNEAISQFSRSPNCSKRKKKNKKSELIILV